LKGSRIGQSCSSWCHAVRGWQLDRAAGADTGKIAQPEFRIASSNFGASAACARKFAAVQRGWRDFRMAP
jgi:hypothetical protein